MSKIIEMIAARLTRDTKKVPTTVEVACPNCALPESSTPIQDCDWCYGTGVIIPAPSATCGWPCHNCGYNDAVQDNNGKQIACLNCDDDSVATPEVWEDCPECGAHKAISPAKPFCFNCGYTVKV